MTAPLRIERVSEHIRHVVHLQPPANLITPETVSALHAIIHELAADDAVRVVVFRSDLADFFFNHFDLRQAAAFPRSADGSRALWTDMVLQLSRAPFVSIASIRGRTRGGGNEFALACDLRYASVESASFGQPEVGTGIVPGGGGTEWLPRLIGRDRALEAILGADDFDALTAERYGWITRALPDEALDGFVDDFATRLAGLDARALRLAKRQVDRASLPPSADLESAYAEYSGTLGSPGMIARMTALGRLLAEHGADVELRLGHHLGQVRV